MSELTLDLKKGTRVSLNVGMSNWTQDGTVYEDFVFGAHDWVKFTPDSWQGLEFYRKQSYGAFSRQNIRPIHVLVNKLAPSFSVGDLVRIKKSHRLESDIGSTRGVVVDTQKVDAGEWGLEFNARVVFTNGELRGEKYWLAFESLKHDKKAN